jgi:hypothetical protein
MRSKTGPISVKILKSDLCHYCNVNKLDPAKPFVLPNGISVCESCHQKHAAGTPEAKRR